MKSSVKAMIMAAILAITPCMSMHADFGIDSFVIRTTAFILWTGVTIGAVRYLSEAPKKITSPVGTQSIMSSNTVGVSSKTVTE